MKTTANRVRARDRGPSQATSITMATARNSAVNSMFAPDARKPAVHYNRSASGTIVEWTKMPETPSKKSLTLKDKSAPSQSAMEFAHGLDQEARTNQPSAPSLPWQRGHDPCRRAALPERSRDRTTRQGKAGGFAQDQAGGEQIVRPAEADRCRPPECRLRRNRPRRWTCGHSSARLALRHSQLCRCHTFIGVGGLSGDRPVSARLRHDALSFK